ncbi:hypothetical protein KUV73_08855 [Mameliella alba]|nr:hypothetical protein [Mameliella alba]MBY6169451.1 hypothetical protein [Mameliella alba]MBY6174470.1 hypothetical protein [Mameliella alba]
MALTDFSTPMDLGSAFAAPRISAAAILRIAGCALALFAYMIWIVPMGIDAPILVPFKLLASCVMLNKALELCLGIGPRPE